MQTSLARNVQWVTRRQDAGHLSVAFFHAARAHRSQRSIFPPSRPCNSSGSKEQFKIVKLPPSLRRFPAMGQQDGRWPRQFQFTPADEHQFGAVVGHSAGDIPTVYARPIKQPAPSRLNATLQQHGAHMLLMGGISGMAIVALFNGVTTAEIFFTTKMAQTMVSNIPFAGCCASAGDVVAQLMTGTGLKKLDFRRVIAAGAIGGMLQGFGTTAWLWNLNISIPRSLVGFDDLSKFTWLTGKVLLDSAAWGTVINTINVGARRIAAGDSVIQAYHNWREKILSITQSEFKFWPAFGALVYTCVPEAQQVNAFGLGGFVWSVYLSYAANHGVTSNKKGLFRYGRPTGVRVPASSSSLDDPVTGRVVLARFDVKSTALPLHGAAGRPRAKRSAASASMMKRISYSQ